MKCSDIRKDFRRQGLRSKPVNIDLTKLANSIQR